MKTHRFGKFVTLFLVPMIPTSCITELGPLLGLGSLAAIGGCSEQLTLNEKVTLIDKVAEVSERHGLAMQANIDIDAPVGVGMRQEFYLRTPFSGSISLQSNAASAPDRGGPFLDVGDGRPPSAGKNEDETVPVGGSG